MSRCPDCGDPLLNPTRCDCGWKAKSGASDIPPCPHACNRHLCDNDADVVFLRVRAAQDRVVAGAASDFMDKGRLRSGFTFHDWVARCAQCYDRDLRLARKQQLKVERPPAHDVTGWSNEEKLIYLRNLIGKLDIRRMPEPEPQDYLDEPYAQDGR